MIGPAPVLKIGVKAETGLKSKKRLTEIGLNSRKCCMQLDSRRNWIYVGDTHHDQNTFLRSSVLAAPVSVLRGSGVPSMYSHLQSR